MKLFPVLLIVSFFTLTIQAQTPCAQLTLQEAKFNKAAKLYLEDVTSEASKAALESAYAESKAVCTNVIDLLDGDTRSIAGFLGIKAVVAYTNYFLHSREQEKELLREAQWAIAKFLPVVDFADNYTLKCNTSANSYVTIEKAEFKKFASILISDATEVAFNQGKSQLAMELFMKGHYYMNGYHSNANVYSMTGLVLRYRLDRDLIDDTTFIASYFHLKSMHELNSLGDIAAAFGKSYEQKR
ncbi:MAG TPA: hypothetical protein VHL77_00195 [Ferruginibacter sp.]|jgi:hypothetical protein|nr:hypothetical protein [Ferruginibacter sp.]